MLYTITTDVDYVTIQSGMQKVNILKSKISGINTVSGTAPKLIILIDSGSSPYTMNFEASQVVINTVAQTTLAMAEATLKGEVQVGTSEVFTATVGQTTFSPTFTANVRTRVYVNGSRTLTGFTVVSGDIVFAPALAGGEVVILENV